MKGASLRNMVVLKCVSFGRRYVSFVRPVWVYHSSDRITVDVYSIAQLRNAHKTPVIELGPIRHSDDDFA